MLYFFHIIATNICGMFSNFNEGFQSVDSNNCHMKNIAFGGDLEYVGLLNCSSNASAYDIVDESSVCTTYPSEDSCQLGSSGGWPIYDKEVDALVGVLSTLKDCTDLSVNTQISNELGWMRKITCENQTDTNEIINICSMYKMTSQILKTEGRLTELNIVSETRSLLKSRWLYSSNVSTNPSVVPSNSEISDAIFNTRQYTI